MGKKTPPRCKKINYFSLFQEKINLYRKKVDKRTNKSTNVERKIRFRKKSIKISKKNR